MIGDNYMWFVDPANDDDLPKGETQDDWFNSKSAFEVLNLKFGMTGAGKETVETSEQSGGGGSARGPSGGGGSARGASGFSAPAAAKSPGGGASTAGGKGKADFEALTISKYVDLASVKFYRACSMGLEFDTAMLAIRKAGGSHLLYMQYILRLVRVTGVNWEGGSGSEPAKENVTFTFKALGFKYVQQTPKGLAGAKLQWLFSIAKGGSTNTLDVGNGRPAPPFPPDETD